MRGNKLEMNSALVGLLHSSLELSRDSPKRHFFLQPGDADQIYAANLNGCLLFSGVGRSLL